MKRILNHMSNRLAALLLSGAVVLAGTAVAFTQKPKADSKAALNIPVDERPITRELGGRSSPRVTSPSSKLIPKTCPRFKWPTAIKSKLAMSCWL